MAETEDSVKVEEPAKTESANEPDLPESAGDRWWWIITVGVLLWIGFCSVAVLVYLGRH